MDVEHYELLVGELYEGVMAVDGWRNALSQLRTLLNAEQVTFLMWDSQTNTSVIAEVANVDVPALVDYQQNFARIDPGIAHVAATPLGQWYIDARDLGTAVMEKHDFFQLFFRRHGMGSGMCTPLYRSTDGMAGLSFQTGLGQPHYQQEDTRQLAPLMPHLLRATQMRWHYQKLSRLAQLGQGVLDHLHSPVFVVNASGSILFFNLAAKTWLAKTKIPLAQQLDSKTFNLAGSLRDLARRVCGAGCSHPRTASMRLDVPSPAAPTYLIGLPLTAAHPLCQRSTEPLCIIVAHDLSARPPVAADVLQTLFKLTWTENNVLERLRHHDSLDEVAAAMGVSRETVRTHLKSIFRKTGLRSQAELMKIMVQFSQFS